MSACALPSASGPEGGEPCGTPLGEPPETPPEGGEPGGTPLGEPPETPPEGGEPCGTPLGEPPETPPEGGEPCGTPLGEPPETPLTTHSFSGGVSVMHKLARRCSLRSTWGDGSSLPCPPAPSGSV